MEVVRHSVHPYKGVRDAAVNGVGQVTKRYPCLAGPCLPFALAALSGLPPPSDEMMMATLQGRCSAESDCPEEYLQSVRRITSAPCQVACRVAILVSNLSSACSKVHR